MFNSAVLNRAIQTVENGIDSRHVMWELTTDNLDVSILAQDHALYRQWFIGKHGKSDFYSFAIMIETNILGELFTITVRRIHFKGLDIEDLKRFGFQQNGAEFNLDTSSPKEVLSTLDRLIGYLEA
jgi:hypothetical protein